MYGALPPWYFQNVNGVLPGVEIEQDDKFEEMWETIGAEIKSSFLRMLYVTPEHMLVAIQQKS